MKNLVLIIVTIILSITVSQAQSTKADYAVKTQPIQLATGNFKLTYEHSIAERQSIELDFGVRTRRRSLLGGGWSDNGFLNMSARYKFYMKDTEQKGKSLSGLYIAPVITVGTSELFLTESTSGYINSRTLNNYAGAMGDIGYQVIVGRVALDVFAGAGLVYNTTNKGYSYNNSHLGLGGFAGRLGMRVGFKSK